MKRNLAIMLLIIGMFTMPIFAQDETPTPDTVPTDAVVTVSPDDPVSIEPEPDTVVDLNLDLIEDTDEVGSTIDFAGALLALGVFMPSAVGLMTLLTNVVKMFAPTIPADKTNLVLSVLLIGFFSVVKFTGIDIVALDRTLESLTIIGYSVLTIMGAGILSPKAYRASKVAGIPVLGYSKPQG